MSGRILVTGGTGKTGSRLVNRLVQDGHATLCGSRSGSAPTGARGLTFDWYDATTHSSAVQDVRSVYLVAPIGSSDPIEVMRPFIELAVRSGVQRFVLLSSSLIEEGGPLMGQVHSLLRDIAPEWAVLRPSWFMENFTIDPHRLSVREEGLIYSATGDGVVPFIAAEDIAEVALRCLVDPQAPNDALVLTGPEMLTYVDIANVISTVCGRKIDHVNLTLDDLSRRLTQFGIPEQFAAILAGLDGAIAAGAEARTTNVVRDVTGRSPLTFKAFGERDPSPWTT